MISSYYKGALGVIVVFDNSNINSFYSLKNWLREIKQYTNDKCVKYLVCNKIDLNFDINTTNTSSSWVLSDEVFFFY